MKKFTAYRMLTYGHTVGTGVEEPCPICGHKWGPHILTPTVGLFGGGTLECDVRGCQCSGTWDEATPR